MAAEVSHAASVLSLRSQGGLTLVAARLVVKMGCEVRTTYGGMVAMIMLELCCVGTS